MNKNLRRIFYICILLFTGIAGASAQQVKVSEFRLQVKQEKVMIDWKTDGTATPNYFAIQKSSDGINFKTIALVLGPDPKKDVESYGCTDKNPARSSYYRLVHIDTNGNEQVSGTRQLAKP